MRIREKRAVSNAERQEIWTRWRSGESMSSVARLLGRDVPLVWRHLARTGGFKPYTRRRSSRHLTEADREAVSRGIAQGLGVREIARAVRRSPSTISREMKRNGGRECYRMVDAEQRAEKQAKRPKTCKLAQRTALQRVVAACLSEDWSPGQVAGWVRRQYPHDTTMHISHETIYRSLFIQARNVLKAELRDHLRSQQRMRRGRASRGQKHEGTITDAVSISQRPPEVADRAVPGHWEGDLIIGTGRSAIGTLVERSSRATLLVHLPRMQGWGEKPHVKNGPALGGYGAVAMNVALTASMTKLPQQLRKTLTWDRGKELSGHSLFALETGTRVFFADPHSPWQRPTNENTNGLLRQYFPKGTDLSRWSAEDLEAVAHALNNRPRKILGWRTPAEVFEEQLRSLPQTGVATTP